MPSSDHQPDRRHARLVVADSLAAAPVPEALKRETADIRHLTATSLGIDEARRLRALASDRAWSGQGRHFLITARTLTIEAQNALLKLFEEPPADTTFWLIVPHPSVLLPTLRSRLIEVTAGEADLPEAAPEGGAGEFLRASYKERLGLIASLAKKDPDGLQELIRQLTRASWPQPAAGKRALLLADRYVYNRGALKKMLAEELALSLPIAT